MTGDGLGTTGWLGVLGTGATYSRTLHVSDIKDKDVEGHPMPVWSLGFDVLPGEQICILWHRYSRLHWVSEGEMGVQSHWVDGLLVAGSFSMRGKSREAIWGTICDGIGYPVGAEVTYISDHPFAVGQHGAISGVRMTLDGPMNGILIPRLLGSGRTFEVHPDRLNLVAWPQGFDLRLEEEGSGGVGVGDAHE